MKKILLHLLVGAFLCLSFTFAESFEGILTWKMDMKMSGASMQKMPEISAEQKAQMAQMMDNPQMKAMMENNPQMKAQMEMMKKMSSGGTMDSMMPKGFTIKLKNGNSLVTMEGGSGPMAGKMLLSVPSKNLKVSLDPEHKAYHSIDASTLKGAPSDTKFTKTEETLSILGYKCRKFVSEKTEMGKKINMEIFATTELSGFAFDGFKSLAIGPGSKGLSLEWIEGVPLKIISKGDQGEMQMEVTSISKKALPDSDFSIPATFTEIK